MEAWISKFQFLFKIRKNVSAVFFSIFGHPNTGSKISVKNSNGLSLLPRSVKNNFGQNTVIIKRGQKNHTRMPNT
jgi:hypothetical protein